MTLASCAKTTDKYAATRVMEAIDRLDHVISDLRATIFDGAGIPEPASNDLGIGDRKSTRLNSSHYSRSRMPSSA